MNIVGIECNTYTGVAAAINLRAVRDAVAVNVHNVRGVNRVGVHEERTGIRRVLRAIRISVPKRNFDSAQGRNAGTVAFQLFRSLLMDIYAKAKYNRPQQLSAVVTNAFNKTT